MKNICMKVKQIRRCVESLLNYSYLEQDSGEVLSSVQIFV